ncbi:MAG: hypothetical protein AAGG46_02600, partial [Planctomycetota bacterium]
MVLVLAARVLLWPGSAASAAGGPVQVFILAGQSNTVGYGRTENLPSNANGEAGTLRGMVNS